MWGNGIGTIQLYGKSDRMLCMKWNKENEYFGNSPYNQKIQDLKMNRDILIF